MTWSCTRERFLQDVARHEIHVVRAEGLNRHIQFSRPNSGTYRFEIITWMGSLLIHGDCGTYVFSRIDDMFNFFRARQTHKDEDYINPRYWAEKVDAQDKHGKVYEFCQDTFQQVVVEHFRDLWRDSGKFKGRAESFRDLREDVLRMDNEHDAYTALANFYSNGITFDEYWGLKFSRYTGRYIWNCYAIVWAIEQFDAWQVKAAEDASRASAFELAKQFTTGVPRSVSVIIDDMIAGGILPPDANVTVEDDHEHCGTIITAPYVYMHVIRRHVERERLAGHLIGYIERGTK